MERRTTWREKRWIQHSLDTNPPPTLFQDYQTRKLQESSRLRNKNNRRNILTRSCAWLRFHLSLDVLVATDGIGRMCGVNGKHPRGSTSLHFVAWLCKFQNWRSDQCDAGVGDLGALQKQLYQHGLFFVTGAKIIALQVKKMNDGQEMDRHSKSNTSDHAKSYWLRRTRLTRVRSWTLILIRIMQHNTYLCIELVAPYLKRKQQIPQVGD